MTQKLYFLGLNFLGLFLASETSLQQGEGMVKLGLVTSLKSSLFLALKLQLEEQQVVFVASWKTSLPLALKLLLLETSWQLVQQRLVEGELEKTKLVDCMVEISILQGLFSTVESTSTNSFQVVLVFLFSFSGQGERL